MSLALTVLPDPVAVCRLPADAALPAWAPAPPFSSVTRTRGELSIVVADAAVPPEVRVERGFRALRVEGPLPITAIGIMASLTGTLADAGVSVFALSTYDTDYLLVRDAALPAARPPS